MLGDEGDPVPRPDEVHRERGPPSPQGSLCENAVKHVIPIRQSVS